LNVLIECGYLSKKKLKAIKRQYAAILKVPGAVVYYNYTTEPAKMVHTLKYVLRSTFLDYRWDERMASQLYNFRNVRNWGTWETPHVWEHFQGQAHFEAIASLETGHCPTCEEPLEWGKAHSISWLQIYKMAGIAEPVGAGYWSIVETERMKVEGGDRPCLLERMF